MLTESPIVVHPFLRHLRAEKKFFTYKLTSSPLPEKLWAKKPSYTSLSAGMKFAAEAESELALLGAAHGGPFVPGSGGYFYNLGGGDLTQAAVEAIAEYKSRMTPGNALGYYFTADSQRFFYDLDGCRNPETGELTEKAYEAIALFRPVGAYMEVSPSGTGIHIVGRYVGERPAHETHNYEFGLELYTGDRGMAIGTPYEGTGSPDADCTMVLQCLIGLYFPKRTVDRLSVDPSAMGDLSAPDIEAGLRYLSSACGEFERAKLWNNGLTKFFFTVGTLVARGVLSEEDAWAKVCEVPKVQDYLSEEEWTVTNNWARGIRDSSDKPWVSPGDRAQVAGFGTGALPTGATPEPVAGGGLMLSREDRALLMSALRMLLRCSSESRWPEKCSMTTLAASGLNGTAPDGSQTERGKLTTSSAIFPQMRTTSTRRQWPPHPFARESKSTLKMTRRLQERGINSTATTIC
jgi:hypothetical protein